jgi:hypothetical protein
VPPPAGVVAATPIPGAALPSSLPPTLPGLPTKLPPR